MKTYENGIVGVTQQEYEDYGRRMFVDGKQFRSLPNEDVTHGKKYIKIIPAKFCVARFINKVVMESDSIQPEGNVAFHDSTHKVVDLNQLLLPDLIQLRATRRINVGDELFLHDATPLITL